MKTQEKTDTAVQVEGKSDGETISGWNRMRIHRVTENRPVAVNRNGNPSLVPKSRNDEMMSEFYGGLEFARRLAEGDRLHQRRRRVKV